jgi:hypothetical protein
LEEARPGPVEDREILGVEVKGSRPIESDESCQLFELIWPNYVAYCVRNESYTQWDPTEVWEGQQFRIYSKSHFRDYVEKDTFASDKYPGALQHWSLICLNHIVDVIGSKQPQIRRLRPM